MWLSKLGVLLNTPYTRVTICKNTSVQMQIIVRTRIASLKMRIRGCNPLKHNIYWQFKSNWECLTPNEHYKQPQFERLCWKSSPCSPQKRISPRANAYDCLSAWKSWKSLHKVFFSFQCQYSLKSVWIFTICMRSELSAAFTPGRNSCT